jgi:hypothetical protein
VILYLYRLSLTGANISALLDDDVKCVLLPFLLRVNQCNAMYGTKKGDETVEITVHRNLQVFCIAIAQLAMSSHDLRNNSRCAHHQTILTQHNLQLMN